MPIEKITPVDIDPALLDAISSFPVNREVSHCGTTFRVSPFDIYGTCPTCGIRLKLRSFSATTEVEDVFDAVFAWMKQPGAAEIARRRQQQIATDVE